MYSRFQHGFTRKHDARLVHENNYLQQLGHAILSRLCHCGSLGPGERGVRQAVRVQILHPFSLSRHSSVQFQLPNRTSNETLPIHLWVPSTTTIELEATVLVSAIPCKLLRIYSVRTCFYVEFLKIPIRGILSHPCTILILECLLRLMALAHYAGLQMTFVPPAERRQISLWSEI